MGVGNNDIIQSSELGLCYGSLHQNILKGYYINGMASLTLPKMGLAIQSFKRVGVIYLTFIITPLTMVYTTYTHTNHSVHVVMHLAIRILVKALKSLLQNL